MDLRTLKKQQYGAHATRLVQTYEYWYHHTTSHTEINAHKPIYSTKCHLITTNHSIEAMIATISTSYYTEFIHVKYDKRTPIKVAEIGQHGTLFF